MKRIITFILTAVMMSVMIVISISGVNAQKEASTDLSSEEYAMDIDNWSIEETEEDEVVREYGGRFHNEKYNNICLIKYNDIISIFGTELLLYPTFVDQDEAMSNAAMIMADFINLLAQENGLTPLSEENLDEYEAAAYAYKNSTTLSEEELSDCIFFLGFIDIYRDKERNDEIKQAFSSYNDSNKRMLINRSLPAAISEEKEEDLKSGIILNDIKLMLPSYTVEEFADIPEVKSLLETSKASNSISNRVARNFNVTAGIKYATTYATSANIWEWNYFSGGDCTNFVSQIIYAGGIPMDYVIPNPWYYTSITDYAKNWTVANSFANYWGVNYKVKGHQGFARNLGKGDFITADWQDNGSWDHWAFVTDRDTYEGMWSGFCYYDYKVAQHTGDYHLWTSNSGNRWERAGIEGGRYGILYKESIYTLS